MYLSRLQLNPTNRQVWRQHLRNPYKVHQMVMRGFPDGVKREAAQILHRLEVRDDLPVLMVQSALPPDWSQVDPAYLVSPDPYDPWPNPAVRPFDLPLQKDQLFGFRLSANPTVKIRYDKNGERRKNSNRVPLLREDEQRAWLDKRAEAAGFRVLDTAISQGQSQKMWKARGAEPITLYTVQFDGYLQVIDPETLKTTIRVGVGPSRAFGCGLLSLAPVR
jgi:CRISPR system Cascade subunit CasE